MKGTRGVSTVVGYVLALAITAALVGSLIAATGSVVDDRREVTAYTGLEVVGERLAAKLMAADRLARTDAKDVTVRVDLPAKVAGGSYTVEVNDSKTDPHFVLTSTTADTTVRVNFTNSTPVVGRTVSGGDLEVVLTDAGKLEVRGA